MSLQGKTSVNISPLFYIVGVIIIFNVIAAFPFLIVIIIILVLSGKISLEKLLKNTGLNNFFKKQFGANYEKILDEIKKSKQYQQRVKNNKEKRSEVEDLFTDNMGKQLDEKFEMKREEKFKKMQQEFEEKQIQEKIFYQQNQKTLQEKFAESSKIKQNYKNHSSYKSSNSGLNSQKKTHINYFGNSNSKSFGEGKSIWDNYESVTDRFSSNKK